MAKNNVTNTNETTWADAKHFKVFLHPLPGTFGVNALYSSATIAEDGAPRHDTAYVAFNRSRTMLLVLYLRKDGRPDHTKAYTWHRKKRFNVAPLLPLKGRTVNVTRAEMIQLLNTLEVEESP